MCHGEAIAFVMRPTDPETAARRYSNDGLVDPGYTGAIALSAQCQQCLKD
jgi:hypothetical protein